jgi:hypothetical protein
LGLNFQRERQHALFCLNVEIEGWGASAEAGGGVSEVKDGSRILIQERGDI